MSAIVVKNLSKRYQLYQQPVDRLKEALHPFRKKYHQDFYVLNDVSFMIEKGHTVGIVGKNGSGKSTLLKIITGVLQPTQGNVHVNGKVSALLELGTGFNPEYTGRENVFFRGTLMGYSREQMKECLDDILAFADIGEFIDQPVKMYSSGMFVRLAFAVATMVSPDILIVDEALSVGDVRFQQKCLRRMEEFKEKNKTILFVSHSTGMIEKFCDRAFWLHEGNIRDSGDSDLISKKYYSFMAYGLETTTTTIPSIPDEKKQQSNVTESIQWASFEECENFGEGGAKIVGIALVDENNNSLSVLSGGERVKIILEIEVYEEISSPIVGFIIKDKTGVRVTGSNSFISKQTDNIQLRQQQDNRVEFDFVMPLLRNGEYTISPALAEGRQDKHIQHHWIHDALLFKVISHTEEAKSGGFLLRLHYCKITTRDTNESNDSNKSN